MDGAVNRALAALDGAVETLLSAPLAALASLDVVEVVERLETARRRADAVDARVLAEVEERRIAGDLGRTSVADLLSVRLRVGRGEARARAGRARDLGPRRAVSRGGAGADPRRHRHRAGRRCDQYRARSGDQRDAGSPAGLDRGRGGRPGRGLPASSGPARGAGRVAPYGAAAAGPPGPRRSRTEGRTAAAAARVDAASVRRPDQGDRRADRGGRCGLGGRLRLPGRTPAGEGGREDGRRGRSVPGPAAARRLR